MKKHKRIFFLLCSFLVVIPILFFGLRSWSRRPVKIGLAINLSGLGGHAGGYIMDGALLAVDDVNREGGINGHPIELMIRDDRNSHERILEVDKELIAAGVTAIIGHSNSQNTLAVYPYVTAHKTLLISPYTATTRLTGLDDLFCRTAVDNQLYGRALAILLKKRGIKRVSYLLDMANSCFAEDFVAQTKKNYSGADDNVVRFNSKANTDWQKVTEGLLKNNPEAVVLLTEVSMTGIWSQKLRAKGFRGDFIATLWAQSPDLMRYGGGATEGLTVITFISPENKRPAYQDFARKMEKKFKRPANARAVRAYEVVQVLALALRQCAYPFSVNELQEKIKTMRFETIMGPLRFNRFCDVVRPICEVRVRQGVFQCQGKIL